jgi:RNA polymerase sigma-70 factor (ECF subfamily)
MLSDAELAIKAKHGDVQAFGLLVERYKERAYMIALGFLGNPDDAMDISQEAFVKAFKAMRRFKEGREFYPWFYAILRNTCFNHLRKAKVRKERSLDEAREYGFQVPDSGPNPAAIAELRERKMLVRRELENLAPVHREIILLRHFECLSYKEIARVLECPVGTVMSRLYAARRALRALLAPHLDEASVVGSAHEAGDGRRGGERGSAPGGRR